MAWSVTFKEFNAVASWTWGAGEEGDVCSICRSPFDGCPPDCKVPGDDAPVVWGKCSHAFHIQCIQKCIDTETNGQGDRQANCPNCRAPWEFEAADTAEETDSVIEMEDDQQPHRADTPVPF